MEIEELALTAMRMAEQVKGLKRRFAYEKLSPLMGKEVITLLRGFRGSGKTTLLLHLLLGQRNALYISLDHPLARRKGLYAIGKEALENGYTTLLFDEVHTYPHWREDLKALHGEFRTTIVASGSAPLALVPERREVVVELPFLSFREYLHLRGVEAKPCKECWKEREKSIAFLATHGKEGFPSYLSQGGLPLSLHHPRPLEAIFSSIRRSIREDSVAIREMGVEDIVAMERILYALATSPPGELSINSMANLLEVSKHKVYLLIEILTEMGIVALVPPYGRGHKRVRGSPKLLFAHPSLRVAVAKALGEKVQEGALREDLTVFSLTQRGYRLFTIKGLRRSPDYIAIKGEERLLIEVGGEGKGRGQLNSLKGEWKRVLLTPRQLEALSYF